MNIKNYNMKEINLKLYVSEKGEKDLNNFITLMGVNIIKKEPYEDLFNYFPNFGFNPDKLLKLVPSPMMSEYELLRVKCIELECKRLGVFYLKENQRIDLVQMSETNSLCHGGTIEGRIHSMKIYINRVEKELKEKNPFIDIKSNKVVFITRFDCLQKKVGIFTYPDNILVLETILTADEIFNRYKDVLTKEQIKELYKS